MQTPTRMDHRRGLSASLEDYLEAIFHIVARKQAARAKDIAERVGVNRSSVTGALHALSDKGLVNYAPYDVITLTEAGRTAAADVVRRHEALGNFLERVLGVDPDQAEQAACKMEHAVSRDIIDRMAAFVDFVAVCPRAGADWIEAFAARCESGAADDEYAQCMAQCIARWQEQYNGKRTDGRTDPPVDARGEAPITETMLTAVEPGLKVRVARIASEADLKARLAAMGLLPGVEIEVLGQPKKGPLIVSVMGGRLMLGRGMAEKIAVRLPT